MRFRILFLSVICLMAAHNLHAEEDEQWFAGYITLKSQTRLYGKIAVRVDYNVVMFRIGDDLVVYPAHKVESVNVYDESLKINRNFISMQKAVGAATLHEIYEVVLNGEVTVLRKERVLWYTVHLDIPEQDYFVWDGNEMISLYQFRRKIFPGIIKSSDGSLKAFMKEHRLHPNRIVELMKIIAYYNQQKISENQLAKNEVRP